MGQLAHYAHLLVGIGGSGKTDSLKVVVAHRLTATEGQHQPTGAYLLHRPLVDIAVAFQPLLQRAVVLGKGRRVKDDEVELVVHLLQIFEHSSLPDFVHRLLLFYPRFFSNFSVNLFVVIQIFVCMFSYVFVKRLYHILFHKVDK